MAAAAFGDFVAPQATPDNLATFNGNVVWDAFAPPPVNDVLSLPTEPQMIEVPGIAPPEFDPLL